MEAKARLNGVSLSPKKIREVINVIRGLEVDKSIRILNSLSRKPSVYLIKLLKSAISNWEIMNNADSTKSDLYVKFISVNTGGMLKRMMPAAQGRGNRIRKRKSNVEVVLDALSI